MSVSANGTASAGAEAGARTEVPSPRPMSAGTPADTAADIPLADFELLAELGEGAQGRVFLARQASLADRAVVLKVTPCHGRKHLSLARLQHTHIVSLYWVHDETE